VHSAEWPEEINWRLPPPLLLALKKDYPEIEEAARIDPEGGGTCFTRIKFQAGDIFFADNSC